ncbi:hypothetical protein H8J86_08525 [Clostridium perfringens]|uniref:hypothetical protein n=1 Tax=Clostridium perfringens TaxID=1502 RepID=UPI0018E46BAE|nr:hypothetical protein [Clostridium perfringens]MBI6005999.1 hypothetical protein [Clostridium perfringens]
MFRGLSIDSENEYFKAVLYKNFREELCEIPSNYIESITYKLRDCFVMEVNIPEKINYRNEIIHNPIYDKVKAKRQIIINNEDRYEICDDIQIETTKNIKRKKFTAKSFEVNLSKKDVSVPDGTFQLYKTKGDTVNVEEGILNWLENETSWRVGHIDEKAKSTTGLFNETKDLHMFSKLSVKNVQCGTVLFEKDVDINISKQVLNFKINYDNMVSTDSKSGIYKKENFTHDFDNFALPIKRIKAIYDVDSSFNPIINYEFTLQDDFTKRIEKQFTYIQDLDVDIENIGICYETGNKVEKTKVKYRSFDKNIHQWLPFLREIVEQAYDCIFQFDTVNKIVNVYDREFMGEDNGFYLYFNQFLKKSNTDVRVGDIVTRLVVEGKNGISINGVNPLGTNYIEDFSYLLKEGNVSEELQSALNRYDIYINKIFDKWHNLRNIKDEKNKQSIYLEAQVKLKNEQLEVKKAIKVAYIKAGEDRTIEQQKDFERLGDEIGKLEKELNELMDMLNKLKEEIKRIDNNMSICNIALNKKKAKDENGKIFTDDDLNELDECVYTLRLSDEYYTDENELMINAKRVLSERNKLPVHFTTDVEGITRHPRGWKTIVRLGDIAHIEGEEDNISDDDNLRITSFKYIPPRKNIASKITNIEFNNSKFILPDLKTIRNLAITVNNSKNALNLYKNIWIDSSISSTNFKKIQQLGIDTSKIPIKNSKDVLNKIDITGTGMWCTDKSSTDNKNQMYIGSGFFSVTNDNWKSCKIIADEKGTIAKSIVGTAVLGERMNLANPKNTIQINGEGFIVSNEEGKMKVKVGIYKDSKDSYKFGVLMYDNEGNIVMDGDGMQRYNIINYQDEIAPSFSMSCPIFIYEDMEIRNAKLFLHFSKYRANSTSSESASVSNNKFTFSGGSIETKQNTEHAKITKKEIQDLINGNIDSLDLTHTHISDNHKHGIPMFGLGGEGGGYSIAETTMPSSVNVYLNGKIIAKEINGDTTINLNGFLKNKLNTIKITSKTNGRINALLYLKHFAKF